MEIRLKLEENWSKLVTNNIHEYKTAVTQGRERTTKGQRIDDAMHWKPLTLYFCMLISFTSHSFIPMLTGQRQEEGVSA